MVAKRKIATTVAIREDLSTLGGKYAASEVVEPPKLACPACKSTDLVVTKTLTTVPIKRYRRCRKCGLLFISTEKCKTL